MTKAQKLRIRLAAFAVGGAALLIPVTFSPGETVEANEACAEDVCCKEFGSSCMLDGELHLNYYEATDKCPPTLDPS